MITILLPTRPGRARFLAQAMGSVFAQSDPSWRLLVLIDGNDPEAEAVVRSLGDHRVAYRPQIFNMGEAHARNILLREWLITAWSDSLACWLDDDDLMHPHRLERQGAFLAAHPDVDIVFTEMGVFGGDPAAEAFAICGMTLPVARVMAPHLLGADLRAYQNNINHSTAMFRPAVAQVPYDPAVRTGGCDLLWLYTLINRGLRPGYLPEQLYYLRQHADRLTKRRNFLPPEEVQADLARFHQAALTVEKESRVAAHPG